MFDARWLTLKFPTLLMVLLTLGTSAAFANDLLRFSIGNKNSPAFPPYQWYDFCGGGYQGFNKELYRRLAVDLGYSAIFSEADFADNSSQLQKNSLALVATKKADFTLTHPAFITAGDGFILGKTPVLQISQVVLLPVDRPDISDISDLKTMTGASMVTPEVKNHFRNFGVELTMKKSSSLEESLKNLASSEVDYWMTSKFVAQHLINEYGLQNKVKFSGLDLGTASRFYMVTNTSENNARLMTRVDDLIASYYQTGYIDFLKFSVMKKWLATRSCAEKSE
ncbi:ABC transporter substrate-binding protein [Oceanicoccus sp. KOV_DT_Chl]|uniref:substrate-binding periplasmic protein n=1 Tax=Oceanicoccus sp. KOV_DT_Chl TaxID=1904639 RepID=UPI000C7A4649|nr:transporter substrate-binding domain-containing protein [Oceanicoccus sp. KOV_DT_Chl]